MLIIGELINAARSRVRAALLNRDAEYLQSLALRQDAAGVHYLDLNVSFEAGEKEDEIEHMKWAIEVIRSVTAKPLVLSATRVEVLRIGLIYHGPGAMVNAVSAEEERREPFLRLAREFDCVVLALPVGKNGLPVDISSRVAFCQEIIRAAEREKFPTENLYFDALALPLSIGEKNGLQALKTIHIFKKELNVKTVIGLTNISYGFPLRRLLERTFLVLAIYEGLDAVILNPLEQTVMSSLQAALLMAGLDPRGENYLSAFRNGKMVI